MAYSHTLQPHIWKIYNSRMEQLVKQLAVSSQHWLNNNQWFGDRGGENTTPIPWANLIIFWRWAVYNFRVYLYPSLSKGFLSTSCEIPIRHIYRNSCFPLLWKELDICPVYEFLCGIWLLQLVFSMNIAQKPGHAIQELSCFIFRLAQVCIWVSKGVEWLY